VKTVKQRILAGFLTRDEVMTQAQSLAAMTGAAEKQRFWADYKAAKTYRTTLAVQALPTPQSSPMPATAAAHLDAVRATDAFQEHFGGTDADFKSVRLDAVQPLQIFTNVQPRLTPPAVGDSAGLLNYCLPVDPTIPADVRITDAGVQFTTDRYGHGPQNVRRRIIQGQVHVTFEHPNLLQVVHVHGTFNGQQVDRMILINGNHRAYELLAAGHTEAPALVIPVSDGNQLGRVVPQGQGFWSLQFMLFAGTQVMPTEPRPTYVSDFSSPLAIEATCVLVPSMVEITVGVPPAPTPAAAPFAIQLRQGP
jgi:hypothetical protein